MAKRRRLSVEEYTVGWICALPTELAAAQEMLDEVHDGFDNHDSNSIYTLGRIGDHNVVVACLPKGQMGTNSAATVAARLQSSYPAIRFAVLVGIGGGVPSAKADIRLGDVVVSLPEKMHGGVVQYDFGKSTPNGLERTGHLNAPPKVLLEAVAKLQASHLRGKTRLHEYLVYFEKLPGFQSPGPERDVLFKAGYEHSLGETCSNNCDEGELIQRCIRGENPVVHYGTIASGNLVMRKGTERDHVSLELGGVLCFEMEAAGLMNSFGCIVIRGICDYADSHKNKDWQPYASATAAAYTKELLAVIPPASVARIRTADKVSRDEPDTDQQETLGRLPYVAEATFNSYQRQHEATCLDNTRSQVLQKINDWADRQDGASIFWLNGWAGIGKSTIARTITRQYHDKERLGASFFFSRGGGDTGHARQFVTTIARQLSNYISRLQSPMCKAIGACVDIGSQSLTDQWRQLVIRPLSDLSNESRLPPYLIVLDALDECDDERNIRMIIQILGEAQVASCNLIKVFITSRPTLPIEHELFRIPAENRCNLVLHHLPSEALRHDISIYLQHELRLIAGHIGCESSWPGSKTLDLLTEKSSGLFIWCATACRFIDEGGPFAEERLNTVLQGGSSGSGPEESLNKIYTSVLCSAVPVAYTRQEQSKLYGLLRQALGAIVLLSSPLPLESVCKLLQLRMQRVTYMLTNLHAILDIPHDPTRKIRLHHPSFRDFLLDKDRCKDENFWVDEPQAHHDLAHGCLRLMRANLRENMYDLATYGASVDDIDETQLQRSVSLELQYACLFWVHHIQRSNVLLSDNDIVHDFLRDHVLHWLEVLGWMRKVPEGIRAILSLDSLAKDSDCSHLQELTWDARRLSQANKAVLEKSPLQIYFSALLFAPSQSLIRVRFQNQLLRWLTTIPRISSQWSPVQQTLECQLNGARYFTFSSDGKMLASTSGRTVRLWDTLTGDCLHIFQPATEPESLQLEETAEGLSLEFEDSWPISPATKSCEFSKDGATLAAACGKMVYIWDVVTGQCLGRLLGHTLPVYQLAFSCNGQTLATSSADKTVRAWDPSARQCIHLLEGHTGPIFAVAFSPAPHRANTLASASIDGTIRVWDSLTGRCEHTMKTDIRIICALAFSHDGSILASACGNKTSTSLEEIGANTVQLWSPSTGQSLSNLRGHMRPITAIAFSPNSSMLASSGEDATVRLWDPITGQCLRVLQNHGWASDVRFSMDGKVLASAAWYYGNEVRLWDPVDGTLLRVLSGHTSWVIGVTFAPPLQDGNSVLASGSYDDTVLIWDVSAEQVSEAAERRYDGYCGIATSPEGTKMATQHENTIQIWDTISGNLMRQLKVPKGKKGRVQYCGICPLEGV
ncbi:hypothetical protein BJY04DRAFT_221299 [Aspergillus karnatakaensis]|uniref:uncharacterized protein n=1 Tax=Aspergillus karnatakaensis TaxID=1810916 RepID=UPI003CCD2242